MATTPLEFARTLITLLALVASTHCTAAVYKCAGPGGVPVYQGIHCPAGSELRDLDAQPPTLSVVPGVRAAEVIEGTGAAPERARAARLEARRSVRPEGRSLNRTMQRDASERRHIHTGMTEAEVLARLGRPDLRSGAARKGRVRWSYLPAAGDGQTLTNVTFEHGVVADVERKIVQR